MDVLALIVAVLALGFMEGHRFPIAMSTGQEYPIMASVVMGTLRRSTSFCVGRTGPALGRRS
jgi:hypothetical protein